jgi:uncharacterized protein YegL
MSSTFETQKTSTHNTPPHTLAGGLAQAKHFLETEAPALGRIFGVKLSITTGDGWSTDPKTGEVTADLSFFTEQGYTPDMAVYGVLHEVAAHLQDVIRYPEHTKAVIELIQKGPAYSVFHNIFSDIAGNNQIHTVLPKMANVARQTYNEKLFPATSYATTHPRHLQFLYAIIRNEMIAGSQTTVLPEVSEAIALLRNFKGAGDIIKYSAAATKDGTSSALTPPEKLAIWETCILPVYETLLQQDIADPLELSKEAGQPNNGNGQPQAGPSSQDTEDPASAGQPSPSGENNQNNTPEANNSPEAGPQGGETGSQSNHQQKNTRPKNPDYSDFYEEYHTAHHPEPGELSHIHEHQPVPKKPQIILGEKFRQETGFSLQDKQTYSRLISANKAAIDEMRKAYMQIINDRVTTVKKLRGGYTSGALLDPSTLAQTYIDVVSNIPEPPAFLEYQQVNANRELAGKTDYYFIVDTSASMYGKPADQALNAMVVVIEGLAAMQRDIARIEKHENVATNLDIKTAVYTFGQEATCIKPLSGTLTDKIRLTLMAETLAANGYATADFLALEHINQTMPQKSDRKQIVFIVTDGVSSDPARTKTVLAGLRAKNATVVGVAIGSSAAVELYSPTSKLITQPSDLPKLMKELILQGL